MSRLHGWMQDPESLGWTYGGSYYVAEMWGPSINDPINPWAVGVRMWPLLGEADSNDPTCPLEAKHGATARSTSSARRRRGRMWRAGKG